MQLHILPQMEEEPMKKTPHALRNACYHAGNRQLPLFAVALILIGVILLIFCVPLWAYLALIGAALIALGLFLIHK